MLVSAGGIALSGCRAALAVRVFAALAGLARLPGSDRAAFSPVFIADMVPAMAVPGLPAMLRAAATAATEGVDLSAIRVPAVVIWRDRDRLMPVAHAYRLGEALVGSEVVVVPGAGHCPMIEQPTAFADAVEAFVAGLAEPRESGSLR